MLDKQPLSHRVLTTVMRGFGAMVTKGFLRAEDLGLMSPQGPVRTILDVPYSRDGGKQCVDIYFPVDPPKDERGYPFLYFIHGGGWIMCDRKMGSIIGKILAKHGIATVAPGYRLIPTTDLNGIYADIRAGLELVRERASEWQLDFSRYAIGGESAGGHLTMRLAQNFPEKIEAPKAVIGLYGVYDLQSLVEHQASGRSLFLDIVRQDAPLDEFHAEHTACRNLSWDHVPVLLAHGEADAPLPVAHTYTMAELLRRQGVDVTVHTYPDAGHGFIYNRFTSPDQSSEFYRMFRDFLKRTIVNVGKPKPARSVGQLHASP